MTKLTVKLYCCFQLFVSVFASASGLSEVDEFYFVAIGLNAEVSQNTKVFVTTGAYEEYEEEAFKARMIQTGTRKFLDERNSWGISYIAIDLKSTPNGNRLKEHRANVDYEDSRTLGDLRLGTTARFEYRTGDVDSDIRFRPVLNLSKPLTLGDSKFSLYGEAMPVYSIGKERFIFSYIGAGANFQLGSSVHANLAYLHIFDYLRDVRRGGFRVMLSKTF